MDLSEIKYYPDRFYIRLDHFDLKELTGFLHDLHIDQRHAVFFSGITIHNLLDHLFEKIMLNKNNYNINSK